jgi:TonB family protein
MIRTAAVVLLGCGPTTPLASPNASPELSQCLATPFVPAHSERPPPAGSGSNHRLVVGHRISGRVQIIPDNATRGQIAAAGIDTIRAVVRLCVDETGTPGDLRLLKSSCFTRYDHQVAAAVVDWRYSPYLVDGQPTRACTQVEFKYSQQ